MHLSSAVINKFYHTVGAMHLKSRVSGDNMVVTVIRTLIPEKPL